MDLAALIVAGISAAVAIGSVWWARASAQAAHRSAAAAERGAVAEERSAEAAHAALALERERTAEERRDREAHAAPAFDIPGLVMLTRSGAIEFVVQNQGGHGLLDGGMLVHADGAQMASFRAGPPVRVEPGGNEVVTFPSADVRTHGAMTLNLQYRADDGKFAARGNYSLVPAGRDVGGECLWELRDSAVTRVDT